MAPRFVVAELQLTKSGDEQMSTKQQNEIGDDFERLLAGEVLSTQELDSDGDPSVFSLLTMTIAVSRLGNMEHARRLAVLALRKSQRNKANPKRAFYLSLSRALHANVFNKSPRSRQLIARVEGTTEPQFESKDKVLLKAAESLISCKM